VSSLLATARVAPSLAAVLEEMSGRLEAWHAEARTARGERRQEIVEGLADADRRLTTAAVAAQEPALLQAAREEAAGELRAFRDRMTAADWERSVEAAVARSLRDRLKLPTLTFE
jgi:hypothetical protein